MYCVDVSKAVLVGPREKVTTKANRNEGFYRRSKGPEAVRPQWEFLSEHLLDAPCPAPGTYRVKGSGTFWAGVGVILARRDSLACGGKSKTKEVLRPEAEAWTPHSPLPYPTHFMTPT